VELLHPTEFHRNTASRVYSNFINLYCTLITIARCAVARHFSHQEIYIKIQASHTSFGGAHRVDIFSRNGASAAKGLLKSYMFTGKIFCYSFGKNGHCVAARLRDIISARKTIKALTTLSFFLRTPVGIKKTPTRLPGGKN
jgi:hypothetical protein